MKRIEVVLGGQGGQGVRFAGIVLGQACAQQGYQVASSASYGPEVRGTFIRSEVIICDGQVTYPHALNAQYALVLTQEAYDRLRPEMAVAGLILFDPGAVVPSPEAGQRHFPVPVFDITDEMGHPEAANMVMVGTFCALSGLAALELVKEALPASNRQVNEAALDRGYALASLDMWLD